MKGTRIQYRTVRQLPPSAVTVRNYADSQSPRITVAYVYKLHAKGTIEIVNFEGINFVLA